MNIPSFFRGRITICLSDPKLRVGAGARLFRRSGLWPRSSSLRIRGLPTLKLQGLKASPTSPRLSDLKVGPPKPKLPVR